MFNLRVCGVTLSYGNRIVLRDIDLEIKPGEMVGMVRRKGTVLFFLDIESEGR